MENNKIKTHVVNSKLSENEYKMMLILCKKDSRTISGQIRYLLLEEYHRYKLSKLKEQKEEDE